jgi:hypothetical protein
VSSSMLWPEAASSKTAAFSVGRLARRALVKMLAG